MHSFIWHQLTLKRSSTFFEWRLSCVDQMLWNNQLATLFVWLDFMWFFCLGNCWEFCVLFMTKWKDQLKMHFISLTKIKFYCVFVNQLQVVWNVLKIEEDFFSTCIKISKIYTNMNYNIIIYNKITFLFLYIISFILFNNFQSLFCKG